MNISDSLIAIYEIFIFLYWRNNDLLIRHGASCFTELASYRAEADRVWAVAGCPSPAESCPGLC